jgi:hypothetical protein
MLGFKKISEFTESDLQGLVDREIAEGKSIEYKSELPGAADADKKEFLFDVSSFANAGGGHLIYGITEENGLPKELNGVEVANTDAELRRLQSLILDGIDPRILGLDLHFILLKNSKFALVIQIPKSWLSPHMVTAKGADKFYSRNSGGKHRLDVNELRSLFTLSTTVTEQVKKFRTERLGKIIANETPIPLGDRPKIILHLVPLLSFSSVVRIDLPNVERVTGDLFPLGMGGFSTRINLDGLLLHDTVREGVGNAYLQFYQNGIVETVNASMLEANGNLKLIPSTTFEQKLIQNVSNYLSAFQKLGINVPIVMMLTLTGVKGYGMGVSQSIFGGNRIDRDVLMIPEIIMEEFDAPARHLKSAIDSVWNAAGWRGSFNFDSEGNYISR